MSNYARDIEEAILDDNSEAEVSFTGSEFCDSDKVLWLEVNVSISEPLWFAMVDGDLLCCERWDLFEGSE